jgi:hypothetical protein
LGKLEQERLDAARHREASIAAADLEVSLAIVSASLEKEPSSFITTRSRSSKRRTLKSKVISSK